MKIYLMPLAILLTWLSLFTLAGCGGGSSTISQPPKISEAATSTDVVDATQVIHTAFSLKFRDPAAVERYIQQMHTPGHENYRKVLTPGDIAMRFAPSDEQVGVVTSYLQARGFSNIRVTNDNLLVEADAPAGMVSRALQTRLATYILRDGRHGFANTSAVVVPANLGAVVLDVIGLDTVTQVHSMASSVAGAVGHDPREFQALYNVGATPGAHPVTVGIIGVGNMDDTVADLRRFEKANGLPPTLTSVNYLGYAASAESPWKQEMNLDSQSIIGMAGGVQKLEFYAARSTTWGDMMTAIAAAVNSNTAKVINMSFGSCEENAPRAVVNQYLQKAVMQGQTFVASSGDEGSSIAQCPSYSISFPASSPYVMAVGGTTLLTDAIGGYGSELAWRGSGGGISKLENIPFWQVSVQAFAGAQMRQLPDLAFVADPDSGANIYVNGERVQVGGTSLSAPLFVATWARMLAQCPDLGFAGPTIYAFRNLHEIMFRDVINGTNGNFRAGAEWDHVTGWGTPNVENMWSTVCPSGASYYKLAQQLYVAYLGRPIDPAGLTNVIATLRQAGAPNSLVELKQAYASNPMVRVLLDCLQGSDESRAVYPTSTPNDYVAALFEAMVGRSPTSQELGVYVNAVQDGRISYGALPLHIISDISAARNVEGVVDRAVLNNRVAIAANFTATLSRLTAISYAGDAAAAASRNMLKRARFDGSYLFDPQVTMQPMYVVDFQPTVLATIGSIVPARSGP